MTKPKPKPAQKPLHDGFTSAQWLEHLEARLKEVHDRNDVLHAKLSDASLERAKLEQRLLDEQKKHSEYVRETYQLTFERNTLLAALRIMGKYP